MIRGSVGVRAAVVWCALIATIGAVLAPAVAQAKDGKRVLLYTGTTGFRHTDAINNGRTPVQNALQAAGYTVDWEDCNGSAATP